MHNIYIYNEFLYHKHSYIQGVCIFCKIQITTPYIILKEPYFLENTQ